MRRLGLFLFISCLPILGISLVWVLTIGLFNWLSIVQAPMVGVFTVLCMLFAGIVSITLHKSDVRDIYNSI